MTDHHSPSSPLIPSHAPAAEQVHAAEAHPHTSKKRSKMRSAWIGFAGRVSAQLIGAIATVGLGYALVTTHAGRKAQAEAAAAAAAVTPTVAPRHVEPAATVIPVRRAGGPTLAVLPFEDFSPAAMSASLADGLTESLTA